MARLEAIFGWFTIDIASEHDLAVSEREERRQMGLLWIAGKWGSMGRSVLTQPLTHWNTSLSHQCSHHAKGTLFQSTKEDTTKLSTETDSAGSPRKTPLTYEPSCLHNIGNGRKPPLRCSSLQRSWSVWTWTGSPETRLLIRNYCLYLSAESDYHSTGDVNGVPRESSRLHVDRLRLGLVKIEKRDLLFFSRCRACNEGYRPVCSATYSPNTLLSPQPPFSQPAFDSRGGLLFTPPQHHQHHSKGTLLAFLAKADTEMVGREKTDMLEVNMFPEHVTLATTGFLSTAFCTELRLPRLFVKSILIIQRGRCFGGRRTRIGTKTRIISGMPGRITSMMTARVPSNPGYLATHWCNRGPDDADSLFDLDLLADE
ncbi:hypothetical protein BJ508DRAFT_373216 [Ascobolus immersus RN42]|uniref:Uncharacterized protein n=1 Tax=Ascobolus immersus RN42 TaxID=1160509 RepID=A0A3N4IK80_ASCIM|nr:hypothetical protein BJ508DRAFT_373216 [Ascobolus immersus RN42]